LEIEAKFRIPDADLYERLVQASTLAGYQLGQAQVLDLLDRYLDTAGQAMAAHGYACRLRRSGDRYQATLKGLGRATGAVHRRAEHQVDLAGPLAPADWPPSEARDLALTIAGREPLLPLFEIQHRRHSRPLGDGERTIADLDLDQVQVRYGAALQERAEWLELEIELAPEGTEQDLALLVAELQEQWGLVPEDRSKYERAMALAGLAGAAQPDADAGTECRLSAEERAIVERLAREHAVVARRARLLLAWDDRLPRAEIAARSGLSPRRVRYWLRRFPVERLGVFPARLVLAAAGAEPPGTGRAEGGLPEPGAPQSPPAVDEKPEPGRSPTILAAEPAPLPPLPEPPAPPRSAGIEPDDPMSEAGRKTLRFHFRRMLDNEPGTRSGEDIEALHDMRVATRRMRAAFRVFDDYYQRKAIAPHLDGLRRTGQALGAVRDLDVFREKVLAYLSTLPKAERGSLDDLLAVLERQRETAREQMVRYLDGAKYRRFVEQLAKFVETEGLGSSPVAPDGGEPRPFRVRDVAPMAIYERLAAVRAYDEWVSIPDPPLARLHALRIACKRLRYTCEFFAEVLGPESKTAIKEIVAMQDHLGALQDAVVASGILRDYLIWGTWGHDPADGAPVAESTVVAPGAAIYLAAQHTEMRRLLDTFPQAWSRIQGPAVSRLVSGAVSVL
jgi:CHAD domain-containing protein